MKVFGIQHCLTTLYHPQANGMDEQLNQTLVNSPAKFAQDNRQTWDEKLLEIVNVGLSLHGFVDRCSLSWASGRGLLEVYWGWTDAASAGHLEEVY